jgi:DeoR/GlpR family transcriptional regulator of sugar metabolism
MAQKIDFLAAERQAAILHKIRKDGRVLASRLATEFRTSDDTIRRALRELAEQGQCKRVYGGALAISPASVPISERRNEATDRKAVLGLALAKTMHRKQFVFIDGGTTNLAAARMIPESYELTVATQDPAIAAVLATREDITLILIGGHVKPHLGSAVGVEATRQIMDLRPDLLLLGLCALDSKAGVGAFDAEDAAFKQCLVKNAGSTVTAALNEKLGSKAPFQVCPIKKIKTLVVEFNAPHRLTNLFADQGVQLKKADALFKSKRHPALESMAARGERL